MECNDCSQLITTLVALLTAALSGFLSYYFAVKKYRKESQENVERWNTRQYGMRIKAFTSCCGL